MSNTFCMHPFTGLATREDGAIKICCRSHPIAFIQDMTLEEAWNCDKMIQVRKDVLNSVEPDICNSCFNLEHQGVESLRQRHINKDFVESRINLYPNALNDLREDYTMPFELPSIEIKLNNLCNLKCRMCNPLDSTSWQDWNEVSEYYERENNYLVPTIKQLVRSPGQYIGPFDDSKNWQESFEKLIPYLRRVEFAGGEPLMDPDHYRILDMLKPYAENIELKYATNGTTLGKGNRTIHDYWPYFKKILVNVSIDGIHDVYNYIRTNSDFSIVENNVQEIKKIPKVGRVVGAFTTQALNALQIADCIEYFIGEMGIYFYSHRVSHPMFLSAQVLPIDLKLVAINKLESLNIDTIKNIDTMPYCKTVALQQVKDNINYLNGNDQSDKWKSFIDFNTRLDLSRSGNTLLQVCPEFKPYV